MTYVQVNSQGGINAYAPGALEIDGMVHYHPSDADYEAQGWLRYIDTPMPDTDAGEGMQWAWRTYDDGNGSCVKIWEAVPVPIEPENPGTIENNSAGEQALNLINILLGV